MSRIGEERDTQDTLTLKGALISLFEMVVEAAAGCLAIFLITLFLLATTYAIEAVRDLIPVSGIIDPALVAISGATTILTSLTVIAGITAISIGLLRRLLIQYSLWPSRRN